MFEGEANDVTILWDRIMTSMGCCGVNSYLDFVEEGSSEVRECSIITSSCFFFLGGGGQNAYTKRGTGDLKPKW